MSLPGSGVPIHGLPTNFYLCTRRLKTARRGMAATVQEGTARKPVTRKCGEPPPKARNTVTAGKTAPHRGTPPASVIPADAGNFSDDLTCAAIAAVMLAIYHASNSAYWRGKYEETKDRLTYYEPNRKTPTGRDHRGGTEH